jgi:hypothetical protein
MLLIVKKIRLEVNLIQFSILHKNEKFQEKYKFAFYSIQTNSQAHDFMVKSLPLLKVLYLN